MMQFRAYGSARDVDLASAREQAYDNPVFCVQYGHARARAVFRQAGEAFPDLPVCPVERAALLRDAALELLTDAGESALMRRIAQYPHVVETAAIAGEPHRLAVYLDELASAFHTHSRHGNATPHLRFIIQNDRQLTVARLALVEAVVIILAAGLALLGVGAPDEIT
jgi:arginyl-tRNA synthetase